LLTSHHSPVPRRGHDRQKADAASCATRSGGSCPRGQGKVGAVAAATPSSCARPLASATAASERGRAALARSPRRAQWSQRRYRARGPLRRIWAATPSLKRQSESASQVGVDPLPSTDARGMRGEVHGKVEVRVGEAGPPAWEGVRKPACSARLIGEDLDRAVHGAQL
jgi:hypothetical protein